jgi:hypothetical protein
VSDEPIWIAEAMEASRTWSTKFRQDYRWLSQWLHALPLSASRRHQPAAAAAAAAAPKQPSLMRMTLCYDKLVDEQTCWCCGLGLLHLAAPAEAAAAVTSW